ncbi:dTDP-4-dehydrorhamnose reductase [Vibrio ruber DSM 16370]|uniref:dTDP-4-dehydrorhamnose reductase n=1 Tax=Vibrio ruber (strain DSM 16370 / JCM 11486 / BCRC 17186 / CECT 7878 / LMG 23124 / VR1) TaxID=1123498 RepID=A0A1R4LL12_VIBR1|nr:dTDP-4-dehydrorhamnose reductase [Vibrio ruber]SJN57286.1 dTDP-4-dehydrorhamnose reductase [Vibrio ruber DSM 16370]
MKILVTGCNGQVGHCIVQQLSDSTVEFLAVDRDHLDITDQGTVFNIVRKFQPHIIINAAAYTAVDKAEEEVELSYRINRDGPKYLAQAANEIGAAILHISTDYVFSGEFDGEYKETDVTSPQGIYGESKLAGEIAVSEACERNIILRTAWVFGEHGNNFVKTMLRLGKERDKLGIVSDQYGGPTYAGDIAAALIKIAESIYDRQSIQYGIYHFSGLPHITWFDFAKTIFDVALDKQLLSKKPQLSPLSTEQYPTPAKRPANSRLSTEKIKQEFGISASDWQKALINLENYKL